MSKAEQGLEPSASWDMEDYGIWSFPWSFSSLSEDVYTITQIYKPDNLLKRLYGRIYMY